MGKLEEEMGDRNPASHRNMNPGLILDDLFQRRHLQEGERFELSDRELLVLYLADLIHKTGSRGARSAFEKHENLRRSGRADAIPSGFDKEALIREAEEMFRRINAMWS